jgi:hypothetical protein
MKFEEFTVHVNRDGNAFFALVGDDIASGVVGWGATPSEALRELAQALSDAEPFTVQNRGGSAFFALPDAQPEAK